MCVRGMDSFRLMTVSKQTHTRAYMPAQFQLTGHSAIQSGIAATQYDSDEDYLSD